MFYVNHRWLGGTLTNWATLQKSIKRLKTLKAMTKTAGWRSFQKRGRAPGPRVEASEAEPFGRREYVGAAGRDVCVIDSHAEAIAVSRSGRMGVPVVSIVDTNCDPDQGTGSFRGNDDALRSHQIVHVENF